MSAAVQEIAEKSQLLVREEIELAKAEVTQKVRKIVRGAAIGAAAGLFAVFGLIYLLHGLSWLSWRVIGAPNIAYYWGFFIVAGLLFLFGGIAGFLAARLLKGGSPPTPEMAIDEAQRIRRTVDEARSH